MFWAQNTACQLTAEQVIGQKRFIHLSFWQTASPVWPYEPSLRQVNASIGKCILKHKLVHLASCKQTVFKDNLSLWQMAVHKYFEPSVFSVNDPHLFLHIY